MQNQSNQTQSLNDNCPKCGGTLYAYWHAPSGDHPLIGNWYVECKNNDCKYEYNDCFTTLESLGKSFNICK